MSGNVNLYETGTGVGTLTQSQADRINASITFIRAQAQSKYGKDLSAVKYIVLNGMGQPGLFADWTRIDARIFLKQQLKGQIAETQMTGKTVLFNLANADSDDTLWPPILFHESGHAMFDGKGGPNAPAAWRVELEVSYEWVQQYTNQKSAFKEFVKQRRDKKMYTTFPSGSTAADALARLQA